MPHNGQIHLLFPTAIQVSEIEGAAALNESLVKGCHDIMATTPNFKPDAWSCNLYTTIESPVSVLEQAPFDALTDIITSGVTKYARTLRFDIDNHPPRINECWINVYGEGHSQEVHCHRNSVFSGIYYVKAPEGCGALIFHSPMADQMLEPPITERNTLNTEGFYIEPVAGRMVVFRSWLRHSVKPNNIKEERISVAFNVTM